VGLLHESGFAERERKEVIQEKKRRGKSLGNGVEQANGNLGFPLHRGGAKVTVWQFGPKGG